MKNILFISLLISTFATAQVNPTKFEKLRITSNVTDNTATKINVQDATGVVNTIAKSDLIEVLEYASAINLPLTGVAGKIYVVLDSNILYRWNGTIYKELTTDISGKADIASPTFTGVPLAPTATAGTSTTQIATTAFISTLDANNVKLTGVQTITGLKTFSSTETNFGSKIKHHYINDTANPISWQIQDLAPSQGAFSIGTNTVSMSMRESGPRYINVTDPIESPNGTASNHLVNKSQLDLKQNTLTNPITGTGTIGNLSKFTGSGVLGNSLFRESGSDGYFTGTFGIDGGTGDGALYNSELRQARYSSTGNKLESRIVLKDQSTTHGSVIFKVKTTASSQTSESYFTDAMTITGNYANILINTTTDNGRDKLQVVGTISASPATLDNQVVVKSQLDLKVDKVSGKSLISDTEITRLSTVSNVDISGKANIASPTFTGTVSGITKSMVGLGNVDNTTDLNKPISTAQSTALAAKVDKVSGKSLISDTEITRLAGVSNVDISGKENISNKASTLTASAVLYPNNNAVIDGLATKSPVSGSANYIQNGTTQQASANLNISGSGTFNTLKTLSSTGEFLRSDSSVLGASQAITMYGQDGLRRFLIGYGTTGNNTLMISNDKNAPLLFRTNGITRLTLDENGAATFISSVTAISLTATNLSGTGSATVMTDASGNLTRSVGYKVYTALISQSGTDAPTAIVLDNTLGGAIVWRRLIAGQYLGELTSAFTLDKTFCLTGGNTNNDNIHSTTQRTDANQVVIESYRNGVKTDASLFKTAIEIRVYN